MNVRFVLKLGAKLYRELIDLFRLYLDEVGSDDLGSADRDDHRYLSLTGVIADLDQVRDFIAPALTRLKIKCFDFDPDDKICLHRYDIMHKRGIFGQLSQAARRARFDQELIEFLTLPNYKVLTVMIDKLEMMKQHHWRNQHPYHYLMEILVEKFVQFLERNNAFGDIMPEARQGKKDLALQAAYDEVRVNGTRYVTSERIIGRLRAEKLKFRTKKDDVAGLQLCDIIAHPSHMNIRHQRGHAVKLGDFTAIVLNILNDDKYDRSNAGQIQGYGTKYFP